MPVPPTTRASLFLRLRDRRDHAAWVEFVSLYEPVVYRLLRHRGLQDADAREVMQDLFLAVNRIIDRWDPARERGSFRGWLQRVVRNLVINWLQLRRRRPAAAADADVQALLERLPAGDGPETDEFDQAVRRAVFHRAAERVRGEVRRATWQAFWETGVVGASPAEAGQKLGMTAGAVRVAKYRVLARLRAVVQEMKADE
jgi:RNA polymerase sigma-70 factor (ECF subfamily)